MADEEEYEEVIEVRRTPTWQHSVRSDSRSQGLNQSFEKNTTSIITSQKGVFYVEFHRKYVRPRSERKCHYFSVLLFLKCSTTTKTHLTNSNKQTKSGQFYLLKLIASPPPYALCNVSQHLHQDRGNGQLFILLQLVELHGGLCYTQGQPI